MRISVAIPTYEYSGKGSEILEISFKKFEEQTFKDLQVVVSDHSLDDNTLKICQLWEDRLNIKYVRNEKHRGSPAHNTTNAIKHCDGEIIKILCADDLLYDKHSLEKISLNFTDATNWLFSGYVHSYDRVNFFKYHLPTFNPSIGTVNTLGTPSALTVRNYKDLPEFDMNLTYAYDCDFYKRMFDRFGMPVILTEITMINFLWSNSITSSVSSRTYSKRKRLYN